MICGLFSVAFYEAQQHKGFSSLITASLLARVCTRKFSYLSIVEGGLNEAFYDVFFISRSALFVFFFEC